MARICIVTEELPYVGRTGGIGAAMHEVALVLAKAGHRVDLLYHNVSGADADRLERAQALYAQSSIRMMTLDCRKFIDAEATPRAVSFAVYRTLTSVAYPYDFVHFADYKGFGFYPLLAKHQGLAFSATQFVVQLHGPTRWTIEANSSFFTHEEQLAIDFMESRSIELADKVVAPSQYIADWVNKHMLANPRDIAVIRNLCGDLQARVGPERAAPKDSATTTPLREIVIFGRHEDRKGIDIACQALSRISKQLDEARVSVSFIGNTGIVSGQSSLIYLHEASLKWDFPFAFHFGLSRDDVAAYLADRDDVLVVVPSPYENSPYTVLETLIVGAPLLCSSEGGARELIDERDRESACTSMSITSLAESLLEKLGTGIRPARLSEDDSAVAEKWNNFHAQIPDEREAVAHSDIDPLVTVGITHFERPAKLFDAVLSIIKQDYDRIELIVCDDGSRSKDALSALEHIEVVLSRVGGRLVRRKNGYLGAARNSILAEATGEYVIFLDDDDIAAPNMVSTLVGAAHRSKADVISCLNYFMPEGRRGEVLVDPDGDFKVSYFPLGGPLSLSTEQNVFGSATALFRREAVLSVGGYTEIYGVGHEDYELYINLAIAGHRIEVCPEALFFYEVGRPSMVSATSLVRNFNRCFHPIAANMPQIMVDYVNLSAGRTAYINQRNRSFWLNDQKSTRALRHEIMSDQLPLERSLELAAQLAEQESNRHAAAAFRAGLDLQAAIDRQRSDHPPLKQAHRNPSAYRAFRRSSAAPTMARSLMEARFLFALDRGQDALHYIEDYIGTRGVSADLILALAENINQFAALRNDPRQKAIVAEIKRAHNASIVPDAVTGAAVAGLTGDEALAREVLDAAIDADGSDYLLSNGDVAEAVANGFTDPLRHFLEFGMAERRGGFGRTLKSYALLTSNAKLSTLSHRGITPSLAAMDK